MRVLSMEFNSEFIHIFQVDVQKKQAKIEKCLHLAMPANGYSGGMLINNDRSISDLIAMTLKQEKIKEKKTVVSISGMDCMTEEFSIPNAKPREFEGMIEQELAKRRKLNSNYIYDYIVLGKDMTKDGYMSVRVVLCPKTLISNYYDVLDKAGLTPYRIDLTNHSMEFLARKSNLSTSSDISILACINKDEAHFIYCGRNEEPYYRHAVIKKDEGIEESMFILSANSNFNLGDEDERQQQIETIVDNVTKLSRFHSQRHPDLNIKAIYIYGDDSDIPYLCNRIENAVGIPAKSYNVINSIATLGTRMNEPIKGSISVIGNTLAILDPPNENFEFFEKIQDIKNDGRGNVFWLPTIISLFLLVAIAAAFSMVNVKNRGLKERLAVAEEYTGNPQTQELYDKIQLYMENIDEAYYYAERGGEYVNILKNGDRMGSKILREIDAVTIDGVRINSAYFNKDTLTLNCYGDTQNSPADFARVLTEQKKFSKVSYTGFSAASDYEGNSTYNFTITLTVDMGGDIDE